MINWVKKVTGLGDTVTVVQARVSNGSPCGEVTVRRSEITSQVLSRHVGCYWLSFKDGSQLLVKAKVI